MSVARKFGVAAYVLGSVAIVPHGGALAKSNVAVLYNFTGGNDGGQPYGRLLRDKKGNLFGTTYSGGTNNLGTVFTLTPSGKETVLYSFKGGTDGAYPQAGLVADKGGNLYGTTSSGGAMGPHGTVFKLTPAGKETVLYSFTGATDGGIPVAPLVRDDAGNLYGTASSGGAAINGGVVFQLTASGKETVLHTFEEDGQDGYHPFAGLYMDSKGNLFGTAYDGGASFGGVVYEITTAGKEKLLYTFSYGSDGGAPEAGLIRDAMGKFYGTTYFAGANGNGVVFKLTPKGTETPIYAFTGGDDGGNSDGTLVMDSTGNLYGTTILGGKNTEGVVFAISPKGKETVQYAFTNPGEGVGTVLPKDLIIDGKGHLYGVASGGGKHNAGMVFEAAP